MKMNPDIPPDAALWCFYAFMAALFVFMVAEFTCQAHGTSLRWIF